MSTKNGTATNSIILSLRNDQFKSITYHHFRLLGTSRDRDREVRAQRDIFDDLVKGARGVAFYKLKENRRVAVNEKEALECEYTFAFWNVQ